MLRNILINTGSDIRHRASDFEKFFENFGTVQSTSLLYGIITCAQPTVTKAIDGNFIKKNINNNKKIQ